jgi:histidinol dehydrogenase
LKILKGREFKTKFLGKLIKRYSKYPQSVESIVKKIAEDIKRNGNKALFNYIKKYDNVVLDIDKLKVTDTEIKQAYGEINNAKIKAIKVASNNIYEFHKIQKARLEFKTKTDDAYLGQIVRPIDSVGIYSPGGRNPYPSSILMCAIPAKVAEVKKIIACTPPNINGGIDPTILVAADQAGVNQIYKVGGAQAIAAMAYGTESIPAVDRIVGPGNIYVTAAKSYVSRDVAIDFPAGPTELVIIADETANSKFIASDILAQAEHDPNSIVILMILSEKVANEVKTNIEEQKKDLLRKEIIESSLSKNGFIIIVEDLAEAISLSNDIAPEHLEISTCKPYQLLSKVQNAGAIFLGEYSPVALGDYTIGTNHVLPTGGWARVYSGLSIRDFIKTISFVNCSPKSLEELADETITMSEMEGLDAHSYSIKARRRKV